MRRVLDFLGAEGEGAPLKPRVPDGWRIYAVGDVHGEGSLLAELLLMIEQDNASREPAKTVLIFLGDLIDRGPDSSGVLTRLRKYRHEGVKPVFLMGNHEEVLLRILDGEDQLIADWLDYGGRECLASYGLQISERQSGDGHAIRELIRETVPGEDIEFLRTFSDTFEAGDYLFVHAGIRPDIEIEEQSVRDLRWIREPFLDWQGRLPKMVVHGHTIDRHVVRRGSRIGIDTGAYHYGVLTAIGLEGGEQWILQAAIDADR